MVVELGHENMREQAWTTKNAVDEARSRRCFHHAVAACAGGLGAHMAIDPEALTIWIDPPRDPCFGRGSSSMTLCFTTLADLVHAYI